MASRSEIESMIVLLEDPDPEIHLSVADHMARLGESAVPMIDEFRAKNRNHETGKILSMVLHKITFPSIEQDFLTMLDLGLRDLYDLEKAMFLLCRIGDPTLRTEMYSRRLSKMSQEMWADTHFAESGMDEARIAISYIFSRYGLMGPEGDRHASSNTYIHRVLDTKRGIPLSLALITLFVTNRIHIPLLGINFPFHFLLATERDGTILYVDPTHAERMLTRSECDQFLQLNGLEPSDSYYNVASPIDMLARSMRNLLAAYQEEKDTVRYHNVKILLEHLNVYHSL
jgi:regulator of sirC expression with transglutaminase-like and TPR domain